MSDFLKQLFKHFRVAESKDTQTIFELMNTSPHRVYVRDVNSGVIGDVAVFAKGPFFLRKNEEDGGFYIKGTDARDDRERHLKILEDGTVELRNPNEGWHKPNMGAIRLYIPKEV